MDLSQFTTADLQAMQSGDLSKVSTQGLLTMHAQAHADAASAELAREKVAYDPTNDMTTGDRVLAGIGRGMTSVGRGLAGAIGLQSSADTADAKQTDAPLMATTSGKVGSAVGTAAALAPIVFIPGANTMAGAAAIGAGTGALTTEGGIADRAAGAAGGAAGGMAGLGAGRLIGAGASMAKNALVKAATEDAPRVANVAAAQDAGYVLPPVQVAPTLPNALIQAISGPIKTTQAAAAKNQTVTNALAARAVGLPEDQPITKAALDGVRNTASQAYSAVSGSGTITPTPAYEAALDAISAPYQQAAAGFPNAKPNPIIASIDELRSPSFDASSAVAKISELRAQSSSAYASGDKATGAALKAGANAVEDAVDQHLVQSGAPADTLQAFRDARTTIAKTYDIQSALKGDNVSAPILASTQARSNRLTDELATIAQTSTNFPKATKVPLEAPSPYSAVDAGLGAGSLMTNPLLTAGIIARPAVRAAALSQAGQAAARFQPGPTTANALAQAMQNPAIARALMVGGTTRGSNLLASYAGQ